LPILVADCEAGRLLYLRGDLKNQRPSQFSGTSIAKLFCGEAANRAAHNAVQIYGGYGYSARVSGGALLPAMAKVLNIYEAL